MGLRDMAVVIDDDPLLSGSLRDMATPVDDATAEAVNAQLFVEERIRQREEEMAAWKKSQLDQLRRGYESLSPPEQAVFQAGAGATQAALGTLGNAARAVGVLTGSRTANDLADDFNRASGGEVPGEGFLGRGVRGAANSLARSYAAGRVGGVPAIIGEAALSSANQAYTEARDAGLPHEKALGYALTSGGIEGTITAAFQKFMPGLESVIARQAAGGATKGALATAIGQHIKATAQELPEEGAIAYSQALADTFFGVNPKALEVDTLSRMALDTIVQVGMMGAATGTVGALTGEREQQPDTQSKQPGQQPTAQQPTAQQPTAQQPTAQQPTPPGSPPAAPGAGPTPASVADTISELLRDQDVTITDHKGRAFEVSEIDGEEAITKEGMHIPLGPVASGRWTVDSRQRRRDVDVPDEEDQQDQPAEQQAKPAEKMSDLPDEELAARLGRLQAILEDGDPTSDEWTVADYQKRSIRAELKRRLTERQKTPTGGGTTDAASVTPPEQPREEVIPSVQEETQGGLQGQVAQDQPQVQPTPVAESAAPGPVIPPPSQSSEATPIQGDYPGATPGVGNAQPEPEKKVDREFSSTQVNLPEDVAGKVLAAGSKIADEDLAEKGRETEPHVTVKFGLHTNIGGPVRKIVEGEPPIRMRIKKTSVFNGKEYDVVKADVESDDLRRINKKISDALPHTDTHPDYKPHVTLAYVKPGMGAKYAGMSDLEGQEIVVDSIVFSDKSRKHVSIPLRGRPEAKQPAENTAGRNGGILGDPAVTPAPAGFNAQSPRKPITAAMSREERIAEMTRRAEAGEPVFQEGDEGKDGAAVAPSEPPPKKNTKRKLGKKQQQIQQDEQATQAEKPAAQEAAQTTDAASAKPATPTPAAKPKKLTEAELEAAMLAKMGFDPQGNPLPAQEKKAEQPTAKPLGPIVVKPIFGGKETKIEAPEPKQEYEPVIVQDIAESPGSKRERSIAIIAKVPFGTGDKVEWDDGKGGPVESGTVVDPSGTTWVGRIVVKTDDDVIQRPWAADVRKPQPKAEPAAPKKKKLGKKPLKDRAAEARAEFLAAMDEAEQAIREAGLGMNQPLNPKVALAVVKVAAKAVKAGVLTFADFVGEFAQRFGREKIPGLRNYLEKAWDAAVESEGAEPADYEQFFGGYEQEGAAGQFGTIEEPDRVALGKYFGDKLASGASYQSILDARKEAGQLLGGDVRPGTPAAKHVDEAVEQGVVRAARAIAGGEGGGDPAAVYDALVDLYGRQPNLGVRTSTSIQQQAYSTPAPLAFLASEMAGVKRSSRAYDSAAGNGMLLIVASPDSALANELNPERASAITAQGIEVTQRDATEYRPGKSVDAVVINPPFGRVTKDGNEVTWNIDGVQTNQVDHAITLNTLPALKAGGRATIILGAKGGTEVGLEKSKGYLGSKRFFDKLYDTYKVVDHFTVDGDLYSRQGAKFPVDVIVIDGQADKSRPRPWDVKGGGTPKVYRTWEELKNDKLTELADRVERPSPAGLESGSAQSGDSSATEREGNDLAGVPGAIQEPLAVDGSPDVRAGDGPATGVQSPVAGSDGDAAQSGGNNRKPRRNTGVSGGARTERGKEQPVSSQNSTQDDGQQRPQPSGGAMESARSTAGNTAQQGSVGENEFQVAYKPQSKITGVDTLLPRNHVDAVRRALEAIEEKHGAIDKFVAREIGFADDQMAKAFSAEQVDALAMAISNHKSGEGFILGDQTGVGKGRVAAGMIAYAKRQGLVPVFITEKPDLFGDMVRDLTDIGVNTTQRPFNPLATNDLSGAGKLTLPDGRVLKQDGKAAQKMMQEALDSMESGRGLVALAGKSIVEHDAIFTTYNQLQSVKGQPTWRNQAMNRVARHGAFFILDESHNAGGQGQDARQASGSFNRAEFIRHVIQGAGGNNVPGVYFSSATYAKRPEVMDLYARTGMGRAVKNPEDLPAAIAAGKVPLQQVVSEMLAEAGQYLRRERTYNGVEFGVDTVDVDLKAADRVSESFRAIQKFDKLKEAAVDELADHVVSGGGKIGNDTSVGQSGVQSTNFTSILWNIVDQQLMALKADATAERAIQAWKAGEVPVIAVDNTMETALGHYLEKNPAKSAQKVNFTFRELLRRYLERTREVIVKKDVSDPKSWERHYLTDDELSAEALAAYSEAKRIIDAFDVQIPASPIDWIRYRLEQAGMRVAEITGRKQGLQYADNSVESATLWDRPEEELGTAGKVETIRKFNGGELDAVILNRSGATGVSLHASSKFKNQKPRRMVIAQAAKNIDEFMQILGRIHRTGQVVLPRFSLLMTNAPAENRPASVLLKKMSMLNANVTGKSAGAVTFDAPDILNEVGDQVVAEYLNDHRSVWDELDRPIPEEHGVIGPAEDAARKVSGRVALLPVEAQEHFWDEVSRMYAHHIAEMDNQGTNPLNAKTIDMKARTIERFRVFDGVEDSSNPFEQPAYIEKVDAKRQGQAMSAKEVAERLQETLGVDANDQYALNRKQTEWANSFSRDLRTRAREYAEQKIAQSKPEMHDQLREQFNDQFNTVTSAASLYSPGTVVTYNSWESSIPGVVIGFKQNGKAKNPAAPSSWMIEIAVADAMRKVSIPVSQAMATSNTQLASNSEDVVDVLPNFDSAASVSRETRYVATGNLLAAFDQLRKENGRIVFFTDDAGKTRRGLLMPQKFDPQAWQEQRPVVFENAKDAMKFMGNGGTLYSPDRALWVITGGGHLIVRSHKSKSRGGKYTTNDQILAAAKPSEFVSSGQVMTLEVPVKKAGPVLEAILKLTPLQATENRDEARRVIGQTLSKPETTDAASAPDDQPTNRADDIRRKADSRELGGPQASGFLGGGIIDRRRDEIAPELKADLPEVERQLQAAYGTKPDSLLDRLRDFGKTAAAAATRAQLHIPQTGKNAVINEMFRLAKQFAPKARDEANRNIAAIVDPLGPQQLQLFTRKLIIDNLLAAVDRGEPLRFGFDSRDEVMAYKDKLDRLATATPEVREALERRRTVVREMVEQLVEMELLPQEALSRADTYYHQQVLSYHAVARLSRNPQITKKGFQKRRVEGVEKFDESLNYNTSYIEAEHEWMRDAFHQIEKEKWLRELGRRFDISKAVKEVGGEKWRELVRENANTHRIWQAAPGNNFYRALGVSGHVVEDVLSGVIDEIDADDLRPILAMGGPRREMVLPKDIADQLDSMQNPRVSGDAFGDGLSKLSREAMKAWKTWTLFSPFRAAAYNLRNITGDLDPVIGGAAPSFAKVPQAAQELAGYFGVFGQKVKIALSPDLQEARDLAVIDSSLTASDIPELKDVAVFRRFQTTDRNVLASAVKNYFDTIKRYSAYRESVARYAAYLYYKEALESGTLAHYGGARREVVDRLASEMGVPVAAAHLARNLLGDYGDLTVMGNFLREHVIPFYSWQEVNIKRYPQLAYNAALYGVRKAPDNPALAAGLSGGAVAMIAVPYALMQVFNNLFWPDEEDELSDDERASPHLIYARFDDGSIGILRNTGALGDFLENFGLNTFLSRLDELRAGQMSGRDVAKEMAKDVINKQVQGLRPDLKAGYEIPAGQTIYPNVFNPRTVRRDEQAAGYLGQADTYREARGAVTGDGSRSRPHFWWRTIGVTDPRRNAYFEILELRERFREKIGEQGNYPKNLYADNMKAAAINDDPKAFSEARKKYLEDGGDYAKFKRIIGNLDPISQRLTDADEKRFSEEYLTADQRLKLDRARNYAREMEVAMWKMWHTASENDDPQTKERMESQLRQEVVAKAKSLLEARPNRLTALEREKGLTIEEKVARWQADREAAKSYLNSTPLGREKVEEAVWQWVSGELKEAGSRREKMIRFRSLLQK